MILALCVDGVGSRRELREVSYALIVGSSIVDSSIKETVATKTNLRLGDISASVSPNQLYAYQLCTPSTDVACL